MDLHCFACGYNLRGLSPEGACPECGNRPLHREPYVWRAVCHALGGVVGTDPEKIRPETKLASGLGVDS